MVVAEGVVYVQAGAGVVADSRPEREFEETLEKAGAMFKAVEMAEEMS
jgi:anthranilate/para-aminobenzoate synthase component I